jgi:hypothetical protein
VIVIDHFRHAPRLAGSRAAGDGTQDQREQQGQVAGNIPVPKPSDHTADQRIEIIGRPEQGGGESAKESGRHLTATQEVIVHSGPLVTTEKSDGFIFR